MRSRRKRSRIATVLDIAPLVDCVFLLLLFFLLTSSFVEQQTGFSVNLPGSSFAEALEKENSITVFVTAQQKLFVSGQEVKLAEVKKILSSQPDTLVIKADKNVRLEIITQLMDIAKANQIQDVSIATIVREKISEK